MSNGMAQEWADRIAAVIKEAVADGWAVGIGESDEGYHLEVYRYDNLHGAAEVIW